MTARTDHGEETSAEAAYWTENYLDYTYSNGKETVMHLSCRQIGLVVVDLYEMYAN
jgi:hypothetical protein